MGVCGGGGGGKEPCSSKTCMVFTLKISLPSFHSQRHRTLLGQNNQIGLDFVHYLESF